jgi:hypothetical protein
MERLLSSAPVSALAEYSKLNEVAHRNYVEGELAQKYDKRENIIVPFGRTLNFASATGQLVTLGYASGSFNISIDNGAAASIATSASVTAVENKLTASYGVTVDVNGRIAALKLLSDGVTSTIAFTADTFRVFNGTSNEVPFEVSGGVVKIKTANVGVLTAANISVANLSSLSANLGTITGGTLSLTSGGRVLYEGAGFGASSDLCLWFGDSSIAIGSATAANSVFAFKTDGTVHYGGAALGAPVLLSIGASINDTTSPYSGTITVTATGGSGSYTYLWTKEPYESGQTATLSNTTTATVTISVSLGAGEDSSGRVRVTVVDSAGSTATITQSYNFSDPS